MGDLNPPLSAQFKTLRVEEYRLALRNLEQHYQDFLRDSQDSQMFGAEDRMQVESNYNGANQHYNTMVSTAEQGRHRLLCFKKPPWLSPSAMHTSNIQIQPFLIESFTQMFLLTFSHMVCKLTVAFTLQALHHPGQVRCFSYDARCAVGASDWPHAHSGLLLCCHVSCHSLTPLLHPHLIVVP